MLCTAAIYAVIMAFSLIIYHVELPRTKDSDRDQNLGSSEARDPAKFTTVVQKDENLAIKGSQMQLQLGASDFSANGKPLRG